MPDTLETVKKWMSRLVEVGLLLIALGITIQILFGADVSFLPGDIIENITNVIDELGDNGLVGVISGGVIFWLFLKRKAKSEGTGSTGPKRRE